MKGLSTARARLLAALLLVMVSVLAGFGVRAGVAWVDRPFPGFFLLANRVVASVSLPSWPVAEQRELFQATLVAVNGAPIATASEVYARVGAMPAGTPVVYTFERHGAPVVRAIESQLFGWRDAFLIFGCYLFNGLLFAAIGIGVWALSPGRATTWALLGVGLCCSTYALTGMDLYAPHWFFRVHALAECFLPAVFIHLALFFPVRRTSVRRAAAVSYLPAAALALVYEHRLGSPALYPGVHAFATLYLAGAGLFVLAAVVAGYVRARSELVRHRVRFAVLGLFVAFVYPLLILTASVIEGGRVPANVMGFTAFLFPLSIAYAVHKRDLFEIDALVQRGVYYATLSGIVTAVYLGLAAVATHVLHLSPLGHSSAFSLAFTLGVLLVLPYVRERVQRLVDIIFGRQSYDVQEVLAAASTALGTTLNLDEILRLTLRFPGDVLGLEHVTMFIRTGNGFEEAARSPERAPGGHLPRLVADRSLTRRLADLPRVLVRDSLALQNANEGGAALAAFDALGAELIVPFGCQGALTGFLVCGRKRAGTFFTAGDVSFLRTFANQAALSLQNARTYHDLEVLNADLERRVDERTQQLATSNGQLGASLEQLSSAYRTLQASQEQLVAAQKMAAFGRLAAGIAHEMNTPLGAALNGLKIARELVDECEAATNDLALPAEDQATFTELRTLVGSVEDWTRKAVDYIRSVKSHGRTAGAAAPFDVGRLLERDLQPLLMHRLRLAGGTLELRLPPALPQLYGDSARLGQVLANLINNAIDACEGLGPERTRIVVQADCEGDEVVVRVRDGGTGIGPDARERIFNEFYTTKPPGKGTGLGLPIARDIVTGEFGGTLACTESGAEGTTFTIRLPVPASGSPGKTDEVDETQQAAAGDSARAAA